VGGRQSPRYHHHTWVPGSEADTRSCLSPIVLSAWWARVNLVRDRLELFVVLHKPQSNVRSSERHLKVYGEVNTVLPRAVRQYLLCREFLIHAARFEQGTHPGGNGRYPPDKQVYHSLCCA
jgi:hypothetical protein